MALTALAAPHRSAPGSSAAEADPTPRLRPIRALVVHQADVVRTGIASVLKDAGPFEILPVASVFEAYRVAGAARPDLVMFDYQTGDGREATRLLRGLWPRPRLIALVGPGAGIDAETCLRAGADAAIAIENVTGRQLVAAVEQTLRGGGAAVAGFPPPRLLAVGPGTGDDLAASLTPRERELLFLIGEGLSNLEIADSLRLSVKTVESHRANIARKLNVRSRAGLIRLAMDIRTGPPVPTAV